MSYERLTKAKRWTSDIDLTQEYGYKYIWKRLNELENKIEDGTLIERDKNTALLFDIDYWEEENRKTAKKENEK